MTRYFGIISFSITITILGLGCSRTNSGNSAQTGTDSTKTNEQLSDTAVGILYAIGQTDINGSGNSSLVMLNPNGSIRWRNDSFPGQKLTLPTYADGTIFVGGGIAPYAQVPTQDPAYSGTLHAVDAATGLIKWQVRNQYMGSFDAVVWLNFVYMPYWEIVYGYDQKTGKQIPGVTGGSNLPLLVADSNLMYSFEGVIYQPNWNVMSWDPVTQNGRDVSLLQYTNPQGLTVGRDQLVFVTTQFSAGDQQGHLVAIGKQAGLPQQWIKTDHVYSPTTLLNGNVLYAYSTEGSQYDLYAFDARTGAQLWKWSLQQKIKTITGLYFYNNTIFAYGLQPDGTTFSAGADPKTGNIIKFNVSPWYFQYTPVLCGKYLYGVASASPGLYIKHTLMLLDPETFQVKDSIQTPDIDLPRVYLITRSGKMLK